VTVSGLSLERTVVRLTGLALARGGAVAVADVEEDAQLAANHGMTSAAARMLATGSDVVAEPATDSTHWFPYARLIFTGISEQTADRE
jgi:hypothetical protein